MGDKKENAINPIVEIEVLKDKLNTFSILMGVDDKPSELQDYQMAFRTIFKKYLE